ncbi:hypothetical protein [Microscilla marina]|uniref:Lipoprotein, putative n=1 Tax=Microscilla marina ATCC 23134 TaxID=313606 RepID=A1ZU68_MICM2|nr:hypothetical protein [Microscilla marina]EAY26039.1 lipoprotein, putative [Microscilla marina ATCC 23134]
MKKIILMSAFCLAIGLTACGGDKGGKTNETDTTSVETKDTSSTNTNTSVDTGQNTTSGDTTNTTDSTATDTTKRETKSGE